MVIKRPATCRKPCACSNEQTTNKTTRVENIGKDFKERIIPRIDCSSLKNFDEVERGGSSWPLVLLLAAAWGRPICPIYGYI